MFVSIAQKSVMMDPIDRMFVTPAMNVKGVLNISEIPAMDVPILHYVMEEIPMDK